MKVEFLMTAPARYVKVVVKNWGKIPDGNAGAGNKAWLFVDEIEIN
jgi:hexosaminidase